MANREITTAKSPGSGSALVESIAKALLVSINDTSGWIGNMVCTGKPSLRGAAEAKSIAAVFDSSVVPPIGIDRYLLRLFATFRCSDAAFVAALIIVDRLLQYDGGRMPLTMRNVHRVFFASLVVAVKFHEDRVYSNSHYAKSGGVQLREVNRLERVLLIAIDFDLRVKPDQYRLYESVLLGFSSSKAAALPDSLHDVAEGETNA